MTIFLIETRKSVSKDCKAIDTTTSCRADDPHQTGEPPLRHFGVFPLLLTRGQLAGQRLDGIGRDRLLDRQVVAVEHARADHGTAVLRLAAGQVDAGRAPDLHAGLLVLERAAVDRYWHSDGGRGPRRGGLAVDENGRAGLPGRQRPAVRLQAPVLASHVRFDAGVGPVDVEIVLPSGRAIAGDF